jgi:hypothetical protein
MCAIRAWTDIGAPVANETVSVPSYSPTALLVDVPQFITRIGERKPLESSHFSASPCGAGVGGGCRGARRNRICGCSDRAPIEEDAMERRYRSTVMVHPASGSHRITRQEVCNRAGYRDIRTVERRSMNVPMRRRTAGAPVVAQITRTRLNRTIEGENDFSRTLKGS